MSHYRSNYRVRRSNLVIPANRDHFVEGAVTRGSDVVTIDLEDSVPISEKQAARECVKPAVEKLKGRNFELCIRVNHDPKFLDQDLDAAVIPGVDRISFPKTESADQVRELAKCIAQLEGARGLQVGQIKIKAAIESPLGLLNCEEIVGADDRLIGMSFGAEDYYLQLGIDPSVGEEVGFIYPMSRIVTACKARGLQAFGLFGSLTNYTDLDKFEFAAKRARQLGCDGYVAIHPGQIEVLNRVFSPSLAEVDHARRVIAAFELSAADGKGSVGLDGKMVAVAIYNRAIKLIEFAEKTGLNRKR